MWHNNNNGIYVTIMCMKIAKKNMKYLKWQ